MQRELCSGPELDGNRDGVAVAIWLQIDGTSTDVWSARHEQGTGWGTLEVIATNLTMDPAKKVAVDASGPAASAWVVQEGSDVGVQVNVHDVDSGWGTAERLFAAPPMAAHSLQAGLSTGRCIAARLCSRCHSAGVEGGRFGVYLKW